MLFALFSAFMVILLLSACASALIVHYNGCKQATCKQHKRVGGLVGAAVPQKPDQRKAKGRDAKGKEKGEQSSLQVSETTSFCCLRAKLIGWGI